MTPPSDSAGDASRGDAPRGDAPRWTIRAAVPGDRDGVMALLSRLEDFGLPANVRPGSIAAGEARALGEAFDTLEVLETTGAALYVAVSPAAAIIGLLFLESRTDYFTGARHGHVGILAIAREAEGLGLGRALLATADDWGRARGYDRITLHVFERNARARVLYERAGYAPDLVRYRRDL